MNGLELKKIRKKLKLTQSEMAKKLGTGLRNYQNYEAGKIEIPESKFELLNSVIKEVQLGVYQYPNEVHEKAVPYGNNSTNYDFKDCLEFAVNNLNLLLKNENFRAQIMILILRAMNMQAIDDAKGVDPSETQKKVDDMLKNYGND